MVWGEETNDDDQMSWEISEKYLKTRLHVKFAFCFNANVSVQSKQCANAIDNGNNG